MLTALVSTISNSQVFLLKKKWATHISFSENISVYAIFSDQSFNDTLTNDIVSFEQLDPDLHAMHISKVSTTASMCTLQLKLAANAWVRNLTVNTVEAQ